MFSRMHTAPVIDCADPSWRRTAGWSRTCTAACRGGRGSAAHGPESGGSAAGWVRRRTGSAGGQAARLTCGAVRRARSAPCGAAVRLRTVATPEISGTLSPPPSHLAHSRECWIGLLDWGTSNIRCRWGLPSLRAYVWYMSRPDPTTTQAQTSTAAIANVCTHQQRSPPCGLCPASGHLLSIDSPTPCGASAGLPGCAS